MTYLNKSDSVQGRKSMIAKRAKINADIRMANVFKQYFEIKEDLK